MDSEKYEFGKERIYYDFFSEGPNGRIKKVVTFKKLHNYTYNLAFGDWNYAEDRVDDTKTTNNNDRDKVLSTIADIVIDFMKDHPQITLFAVGRTQVHNRLYQINISRSWNEIIQHLQIKGLAEQGWEYFQKNKTYDAFIINHKQNN